MIVGCGLWVVGCGLWVVGCGLWVVEIFIIPITTFCYAEFNSFNK